MSTIKQPITAPTSRARNAGPAERKGVFEGTFSILVITDDDSVAWSRLEASLSRLASLPAALRANIAVQLRDPGKSAHELWRMAERFRIQTTNLGASLFVNDRVDIAFAVGADGVHLGRRSVSAADARAVLGGWPIERRGQDASEPRRAARAWITRSAHAREDVVVAAEEGADAVLVSPIFASPGKGRGVGLGLIEEARAEAERRRPGMRVLALGGVTPDRVAACFAAGAHGVAAIRAEPLALVEAALRALASRDR